MRAAACDREAEVVAALLSPSSPMMLEEELRHHAAGCAECSDVVTLVAILRAQRDDALRDVRVPAAGQVWWRAAVRAHSERAHAARRPMVWLQGMAGTCAIGLFVGVIGLLWPSLRESVDWITTFGLQFDRSSVAPLIVALGPIAQIALAALACLIVAPLVVYVALSDD